MGTRTALFFGGTGVISSACVREAVAAGWTVTIVNRGTTTARAVPPECTVVHADVSDPSEVLAALGGASFDSVVDFLGFAPDHVRGWMNALAGRTGQYIYISSASAYQKPPMSWPITESTPLRNPFWQYSRDKIACEELLREGYRTRGFPATIVRPSHTYDRTAPPFIGGWTVVERMRRGAGVLVPGDGTSLWTLTHHTDFARAFVGLLSNPVAIGDSFHITTDQVLSWNQIHHIMADAAGVADLELVHLASDAVARLAPAWAEHILGDLSHSLVFDNRKIKSITPGFTASVTFARGAQEIVEWHDADPARRATDPTVDAIYDRLVAAARRID